MSKTEAMGKGGEERKFVPSLAQAAEAAIRAKWPEIVTARAAVASDERQIFGALADDTFKQKIKQKALFDRYGITVPTDAGVAAVEKIKAKYFSKMDKDQLVDSFKSMTSRISVKRREDPNYASSTEHQEDKYWLFALLQRMQDTRYLDDPQGTAEEEIMSDIASAMGDSSEYSSYLESYRNSKRDQPTVANSNSEQGFDLNDILGNGSKKEALKSALTKISLTADLLSSTISPNEIESLLLQVDRGLTNYDLNPIGISANDLKLFIRNLPSAGSRTINDLKTIIS